MHKALITRRKFLNCKQEGHETFEIFNERVFKLSDELEAAAHQVKDINAIMTIFQGMLQEYKAFVQCLTVNKSSSDLDLDETIQKKLTDVLNEFKKNAFFFNPILIFGL